MGFKDFKKKAQGNTIEQLQEKIEAMGGEKKSYADDRFWYPARDKATKKGSAVIRFLPASDEDSVTDPDGTVTSVSGFPWVKTYSHSYQNVKNGKWYIEECPTTIGGKCPMCEANSELWNTGIESDKALVRDRKRRLTYISNILVVSDPATPENEGKVFLYKYGKKIHDKIQASISPEFDDIAPIDVFNMWEGANFALRIGQVEGYTNYDKSEFLAPSAISDDDSHLEAVYNSMYKLSEFIAPSRFKTYDELQARLDLTLGNSSAPQRSAADVAETSHEDTSGYDSVDESVVESEESSDFFKKLSENA